MKIIPVVETMFLRVAVVVASLLLPGTQAGAQVAEANKKTAITDLIRQYSNIQTKSDLARRSSGDKEPVVVDRAKLTQEVRQLITHGASVNAETDGVRTPLMQAMFHEQDDLVELLLKSGANVNAKDSDGKTALVFASHKARPSVVSMLLEHGAEVHPQILWAFIGGPESPDALKGQLECIRLLVRHGAELTGQREQGMTPLMSAATKNNVDLVLALIELGSDVHAADRSNSTALYYASSYGREDIVKVLLDKGASANIRTNGMNWTPLLAAIDYRDEETALLLLDASTRSTINVRSAPIGGHSRGGGSTALVGAIQHKMATLITRVLAKGADPNAPGNERGMTPLMAAGSQRMTEVVTQLLRAGADVNARNEKDGIAPLGFVAGYGPNPEMLELLIRRGAKVNAKDGLGQTALDKANHNGPGSDNARVLLKHGAVATTSASRCGGCPDAAH